jgi:hypothetical protein
VDHPLLGDLVAAERGDHVPPGHDDHAVAQALELLGVGRGDDHRDAAGRDLAEDAVDLRPGPHVDALRRLVREEDRRLGQQRPRHDDLLLVAAGQRGDRRLHRPGLDVQGAQLDPDDLDLPAPADQAADPQPVERADRGVLPDRHRHHEALVMTVRGHVGGGVVQLPRRELPIADADGPGGLGQAGQGTQQLGLAVADDTGHTDDLAPACGERDVGEPVPGDALDHEGGLLVGRDRVLGREGVLQLAADDHREELVVGDLVDDHRAAVAAVAQNGDAVGELPHLRHPVGDVDDRRPLASGGADPVEEEVHRVLAERGRRLVQDQQLGPKGQGLGELEQVLLRQGQPVDAVLEVDGQPDVVEQPAHGRRRAAGELEVRRRDGDEDVLGHGHVGQHRRVLVDDRDAEPAGQGRGQLLDDIPEDLDGAGVGPGGAGRDAHEGRLARTVLPEEGVDLAGQHVDRHVGQRGHGAVVLRDPGQRDRRPTADDDRGLLGLLCHHVVLPPAREEVRVRGAPVAAVERWPAHQPAGCQSLRSAAWSSPDISAERYTSSGSSGSHVTALGSPVTEFSNALDG